MRVLSGLTFWKSEELHKKERKGERRKRNVWQVTSRQ